MIVKGFSKVTIGIFLTHGLVKNIYNYFYIIYALRWVQFFIFYPDARHAPLNGFEDWKIKFLGLFWSFIKIFTIAKYVFVDINSSKNCLL